VLLQQPDGNKVGRRVERVFFILDLIPYDGYQVRKPGAIIGGTF
jgi:hypothetical protein